MSTPAFMLEPPHSLVFVLETMIRRETGSVLNETDTYREWPPPPGWRHAVTCVWEQHVGQTRVQRVLPDGHADLLFYGSGEVEIAGVADAVSLPELPAGTAIRGVRLRPEAVGAALRTSASTLRNLTVPAEDVFGTATTHRLTDAGGLNEWVRGIQPDPAGGSRPTTT